MIAFLVVAGGLVFNIGNVGGGALGFNNSGIPTTVDILLREQLRSSYFLSKNALNAMDNPQRSLVNHDPCHLYCDPDRTVSWYGSKETIMPTASMEIFFQRFLHYLEEQSVDILHLQVHIV